MPADAPFALVARVGSALRLAAVDSRAQALGLHAGMTLADARARFPELATAPHDDAALPRLVDDLARAMLRFTPHVAPDPPDGLILDITGAAHLFGGEAALAEAARGHTPFSARVACAGHAATARALVRYGGGGDDPLALPVAALELPEAALAGLRRAGLATLGDLARRPMAAMAARFGAGAVARLRAILGEVDSPITARREAEPIRAELRFAEPIARTGDMLDAIEDLLGSVARMMAPRDLGGRRFVVRLDRSDGARRRLAVETGRPTRDPAPVMRLIRERIENLADPLDPGFGFDSIALAVPQVEPLPPAQVALDKSEAPHDTLNSLIDRLSTRLGREHVLRLAAVDSHIPERSERAVPAIEAAAATAIVPPPCPRPLLLFDPPEPVSVIAAVPDGPPLRFRWRGQLHEVARAEGPERIAPEWWRDRQGHWGDGAERTRDYYRIEDGNGRRLWLMRRGLYGGGAEPGWYVHGLFA